MTPIFMSKNINDTGFPKLMGTDQSHLKLFVKQNNSQGIAAIGFGMGNKLNLVTNKKPFKAAYCIDENEWNGTVSIQLRLRDIKNTE
jgi:single-stranded-DNA-specific exonuclease